MDALTPSLLAKAFRGELVPTEADLARREKRDYESASALLHRIKCERECAPQPLRGGRNSLSIVSRKTSKSRQRAEPLRRKVVLKPRQRTTTDG